MNIMAEEEIFRQTIRQRMGNPFAAAKKVMNENKDNAFKTLSNDKTNSQFRLQMLAIHLEAQEILVVSLQRI